VRAFSINVIERGSRVRSEQGVLHSLYLPFSVECGLVHIKGQSQLSL